MEIIAKANTMIITIIAVMGFSRMEPPSVHNTLPIQGYLAPSICTYFLMTIIPTTVETG